jgi:hypothetical protein
VKFAVRLTRKFTLLVKEDFWLLDLFVVKKLFEKLSVGSQNQKSFESVLVI